MLPSNCKTLNHEPFTGHSLNLAASDSIQHCKLMKMALEAVREITKSVKYLPRREGLFDQIRVKWPLQTVQVYRSCVR